MKLEAGNRFSLAEYKDPREFGILTQPTADGSFWARVQCQWLLVIPMPEIDDETFRVLKVKKVW